MRNDSPEDEMIPEEQFTRDLIDGCRVLAKEHGYNPTYFLQMVRQHGGVEAVRRLLWSPNFQGGLTTLWEIGRLDASVEAAVLNPTYAPFFTEEEQQIARKRLAALGYTPEVSRCDG
jgi:hypothetical protein